MQSDHDDELITNAEARALVGGTRPISEAQFYRLIQAGIYPPPVHTTPRTARWFKRQLLRARAAQIEASAREVA